MNKATISPYGGFWARFVALIIDSVVMLGVALIINKAMGVPLFAKEAAPSSNAIFASLFSTIISFLYYSLVQGFNKGTLGKHAMGLTLVDDKSLKQISIGQSVGRYFMMILSLIGLGLGYFSVGWHKKKQGWHDRAAGTIVVKKSHLKSLLLKKGSSPVEQTTRNAA